MRGRILRVPLWLAASAIGTSLACIDERSPDDVEMTSSDGGTTSIDEVPACDAEDAASCTATHGCVWTPEHAMCLVDCPQIDDVYLCTVQDFCLWEDETCRFAPI